MFASSRCGSREVATGVRGRYGTPTGPYDLWQAPRLRRSATPEPDAAECDPLDPTVRIRPSLDLRHVS